MNLIVKFACISMVLSGMAIFHSPIMGAVRSEAVSDDGPNGWIYRGVRNDTVFTLIVRRIADGIDGTLLVNTRKYGAFCYDSGNFSVITSENSEMFEVDDVMMGVIVYIKKGPNGYSETMSAS